MQQNLAYYNVLDFKYHEGKQNNDQELFSYSGRMRLFKAYKISNQVVYIF